MMTRRVVVLVLVFGLAGCGGGEPSTVATPAVTVAAGLPATVEGAYNATDVMFLQMMVAHHEPAAALLELGRGKAVRADVRGLAGDLAAAQAAETRTITGWLAAWGEPLASDAHPDAHAAHGGLPALGDKELAELGRTGGADFDKAFLNMLIGHQHGAVELARMELTGGQNPRVKELAARTDETVRARIQQLLRMVAG
jgi:uncharacterized protein (DUF305 family)